MKHKFDIKLILGATAITILAAGCQLSSPSGTVSANNSTEDATNSSSAPAALAQASEKMSDLNLTEAQQAQMKQIREQTHAKIAALLPSDQQEKFKAAIQSSHESPMKVLRFNLSEEQKKQVREILHAQRQQTQAILTPEQQAKWKQHHNSKEQSSSN